MVVIVSSSRLRFGRDQGQKVAALGFCYGFSDQGFVLGFLITFLHHFFLIYFNFSAFLPEAQNQWGGVAVAVAVVFLGFCNRGVEGVDDGGGSCGGYEM